jgi:hypothetical protein
VGRFVRAGGFCLGHLHVLYGHVGT